jgi:hypothetical protein
MKKIGIVGEMRPPTTPEISIESLDLNQAVSYLGKEFAKRGIEAAGPDDEAARSMTIELIIDLQLGKLDEAANRLGNIAKASSRNVVCLACTELPLAFPQQKTPPSISHWKYETRKRSQALLLIRVYPCASVAKLPSSPITHTSTLPADPGKQSNFASGS